MQVSVNNIDISINTGGQEFDVAKPTAILVHGAGMNRSVWGQQTRYIAHHGFNALAIDLPGHGHSGGNALTSIQAVADFLADLIKTLDCEKAMLIGHSLGALACLQTASSHGDKVSAIALCGAAAAMPVHPVLLDHAKENNIDAAKLIASWGHGSDTHKGGNIVHGVWMIGAAIRLIDRSQDGVLHVDLAACNDYSTAIDAAASVTCPALLLLATEDKMAPVRAAAPLLDALSKGSQTIIKGSGHMMMLEAPSVTCDHLMDFLKDNG